MRTLDSQAETRGELSLAALGVGTRARVIAVKGSGAVARRLMEMGVVPGAPVRVIKAAPLGDPIEVRVRGYHLALRRAEAQSILVVTSDE
ncbi:MAG TPA: ferrous iron transport protein A [Pyrinomonadaceae bacterium]|nr:ferrous iron transport protein A [Pyrinomonadaceae bacterium]